MSYTDVKRRLDAGEVVVIDGATGTELQRRGAQMDPSAWCGPASLNNSELLTQVHLDYIDAGADVITANTFASSRLMLTPAGFADRVEEINRIAADHMSTLLFVPTKAGMANLAKEGFELEVLGKATIDTPHVYHCGDIMYDNSLYFAALSKEKSLLLKQLELTPEQYILCTIHRDSNTDDPIALQGIFEALLTLIDQTGLSVVLPIHPRTKNKIETLLNPTVPSFL